jgi:predicted amidohydrolase
MGATTTIGIAQWHASTDDPARNLETALWAIEELADRGSELIVLPELWASGYDSARLGSCAKGAAEPLPGRRSEALAGAARRANAWLVAGSVPELDGESLYNTAVVYGPDGTIRGKHRKAHLYRPTAEHEVFTAGDQVTVVATENFGPLGLAICFDGDFPAYARALRDRGARVVVMVAAYEVGAEHWWDLLHPAHALSNGQWWVTVNQCGGSGPGAMFGRSRVIAPDGRVVAEAPGLDTAREPHLMTCEIDLEGELQRADRESAVLRADDRPEIY